jgi:hypothetical protein
LLVSAVPELADLMQDADGDGEVNALEFLVVQMRYLQVMSLLVCCKSQATEICGSRSINFVCAHLTLTRHSAQRFIVSQRET